MGLKTINIIEEHSILHEDGYWHRYYGLKSETGLNDNEVFNRLEDELESKYGFRRHTDYNHFRQGKHNYNKKIKSKRKSVML